MMNASIGETITAQDMDALKRAHSDFVCGLDRGVWGSVWDLRGRETRGTHFTFSPPNVVKEFSRLVEDR